jgi:hypothetical protein
MRIEKPGELAECPGNFHSYHFFRSLIG